MRTLFGVLFTPFLFLFVMPGVAQPTVDIGLAMNADGTVDVRLYPESDFDGMVSGLVFTIAMVDDGMGELTLQPSGEFGTAIPVGPSGGEHRVDGLVRQLSMP